MIKDLILDYPEDALDFFNPEILEKYGRPTKVEFQFQENKMYSHYDPKRINDQGHITSVCYSPTLDSSIALAMIKSGHNRHGEKLRMVDHLRNSEVSVEITSPIFLDATGSRVRG